MIKQSARAPWPSMRGNPQNTGVSPVVGFGLPDPQQGLEVRHFRTGNGIFSTPIIGADETIYIGSADGNFYALDPIGDQERWRFGTGEVIDSAGCIDAKGTIFMASCDACIYALEPGDGAERWRLDMLKDRTQFSPSTIYWWEANVCQGPNGLLYAPSDDFYLYAIDPAGEVRWAGLTGLLIWSAPAFAPPGERPLVYVASFDTCLYGFDAETGEVVWREPTGNFVASSPAVSDDGTLHVGSFDGGVSAHDGQTGALRWKISTGGPIYASAALSPEGMLYIGSSDGLFYAVSTRDQQVAWTFYAGDAIRSSAALGPDPEGRADYLIYFGAGNGQIYALDPAGQRRWSYDTLTRAPSTEYPNINASVALGRHGLATASANGDVIYIPYDAYRQGGAGFTQEASDGYPARGAYWYHISPGGAVAGRPVSASAEDEAPQTFGPVQTLTLRPVVCDGGARPTVLNPDTVDMELDPPLPHWVAPLPDRSQISVIPTEPAQHDQVYIATFRAAGIDGGEILGEQRLVARGAAGGPSIDELPQLPFSITHMSVHSPPIVPAFDQIGIASLTIDARVVDVDRDSGRVVAWGLLKFGSTESGDAVGTANPRHLFYAFSGLYRDGDLILETRDCVFELTGFPVPLDYLRFAGSYDDSGAPALGTSMVAEHRLRGVAELLSGDGWAETPSPAELLFAVGRGVRSTQTVLGWITSFVGTWFPKEHLIKSLPQMARAARLTLPLAWEIFGRSIYRPWGLFDEQGQFSGVGTFCAAPQETAAAVEEPLAQELHYDQVRRRVVATLRPQGPTAVPGVLIIDDETGLPLYLDYNRLTRTRRGTKSWTVELDLPLSVATRGRSLRAVIMVDTNMAGELPL